MAFREEVSGGSEKNSFVLVFVKVRPTGRRWSERGSGESGAGRRCLLVYRDREQRLGTLDRLFLFFFFFLFYLFLFFLFGELSLALRLCAELKIKRKIAFMPSHWAFQDISF
jgi:hypothetical protein